MARTKKAELYKSSRRTKLERTTGFRYRLKGKNGENLGTSQFYTRKETALTTLKNNFGDFQLIDKTIKK